MREREPYWELKGWMKSHDVTQSEIAEVLNTKANYVNKKINGTGPDFKLSEARLLSERLGVPLSLFFAVKVPLKEQN